MTKISDIKEFREARDWPQERLAAELGVNQATISRWENGADSPKASVLLALEYLARVYPEPVAEDASAPDSPGSSDEAPE